MTSRPAIPRKEFLKRACGFGACSCTVAALFASASQPASAEETAPAPSAPPSPGDRRLDFVRQRFATLLGLLATRVDAPTFDGVLEQLGRSCASEVSMVKEHAGDPDGFFAAIREQWKADVDYDRARGTATMAFPVSHDCVCPLVASGVTPSSICQCSLGWQRQAFETVFAKPVHVELKESILRGGKRCAFDVRVAATAAVPAPTS